MIVWNGAEFLRWEIATAAAGLLLDINPFDEPNVQQSKDATRVLLDYYRQQHQLPFPEPHGSFHGARLTLTAPAEDALVGDAADSFLQVVEPTDYVALLAYVPSDDPSDAEEDLAIPGEPYSFGVLEMAQALGDFQSLDRTGRRGLFVRLPRRDVEQFRRLAMQLGERHIAAGL